MQFTCFIGACFNYSVFPVKLDALFLHLATSCGKQQTAALLNTLRLYSGTKLENS